MKKIEAIIRPERLQAAKDALLALGHKGITVTEAKGHGAQKGVAQQWRGEQYVVDLLPKVSLVAVVHDHEVPDVTDVLVKAARTGRIGDGKIFITPVEQVIRVRTGETGPEAL